MHLIAVFESQSGSPVTTVATTSDAWIRLPSQPSRARAVSWALVIAHHHIRENMRAGYV